MDATMADREWSGRDAGYEGETAVAERRPEVREAHDRLQMEVEQTHVLVKALADRLHDLLGPERPQDGMARGETRATLTDFGGRLHGTADSLGYANRGLGDLLDRLRDGI